MEIGCRLVSSGWVPANELLNGFNATTLATLQQSGYSNALQMANAAGTAKALTASSVSMEKEVGKSVDTAAVKGMRLDRIRYRCDSGFDVLMYSDKGDGVVRVLGMQPDAALIMSGGQFSILQFVPAVEDAVVDAGLKEWLSVENKAIVAGSVSLLAGLKILKPVDFFDTYIGFRVGWRRNHWKIWEHRVFLDPSDLKSAPRDKIGTYTHTVYPKSETWGAIINKR